MIVIIQNIIVFIMRIIFGWGVLVLLSYLIPKDKSIIFITRFSNNFDGNLKYLFLYFTEKKKDFPYVYFLTSDLGVEKDLKVKNLPLLLYPKLSTLFRLLRAGTIIVDGNEWVKRFKYYFLFNARKIQLWHGSGMKTVGLLKPEVKKSIKIKKMLSNLKGDHPLYDLLVLNSTIQKNTRAKAFRYKEIMINGQPRNDLFFKDNIDPFLAGIDDETYRKCIKLKGEGFRLAAYCPTHRKPTDTFLSFKDAFDIRRLDRFAAENKVVFIFKYHQKTCDQHTCDLSEASNISEYRKTCDIYPLLTYCDLMVTDYSSIFVDYLLLDKPVVFFPFDYDYYVHSERALQFDYEEVTPGKKCFTYDELETELRTILVNGIDNYRDARKKVLNKFFDNIDGKSCDRIRDYLLKDRLLNG